jgi:glycosyltransferase involved in cell wall biosynthesis
MSRKKGEGSLKPKIIMLIPNMDFGGAQRVFHDQAKLLSEKFEVIECVFNFQHGQAFPTGNRIISLNVSGGKNPFHKVWQFVKRCWKLYKIKKQEEPIITISHLEGADYVNLLSFGKGKSVLVVHGSKMHDRDIDNSFGWIRKKILLPLLYQQADLIVTVSEGIKKELISEFGLSKKKINTIYNFFSSTRLRAKGSDNANLFKSPLRAKGKYRLITTGRLVEQKNQLPLLHILEKLKAKQVNAQLFFVGEGPLKQKIVAESELLGLKIIETVDVQKTNDHDVVMLGYQENPFQYYSSMDLFLFPSAWEGFPMALGEAMALGMPVLSADCPTGPIELLVPEWEKEFPLQFYPKYTPNGILLPIPDIRNSYTINVWVDAIIHVLQYEELKREMGKSAWRRMELLDVSLMKEKWLNIDNLLYK